MTELVQFCTFYLANPEISSQNYPLSDLFSAHKSHMYTYAHLNLSNFHSKKTSIIKATIKTWNPSLEP